MLHQLHGLSGNQLGSCIRTAEEACGGDDTPFLTFGESYADCVSQSCALVCNPAYLSTSKTVALFSSIALFCLTGADGEQSAYSIGNDRELLEDETLIKGDLDKHRKLLVSEAPSNW
jgi:hypothetical protein